MTGACPTVGGVLERLVPLTIPSQGETGVPCLCAWDMIHAWLRSEGLRAGLVVPLARATSVPRSCTPTVDDRWEAGENHRQAWHGRRGPRQP